MIRTLAAVVAFVTILGIGSSFDASTYLADLTKPTDTGHTFDLGDDRTVDDAFNSSAFAYDGKRF